MRDRIARSLVWSRVVSFASTLAVARLLTPENHGVMAPAAKWTYIILMVAALGVGASLLRRIDGKP